MRTNQSVLVYTNQASENLHKMKILIEIFIISWYNKLINKFILSAVTFLFAGITVSFTKKFNNDFKLNFTIKGEDLMMIFFVCSLAVSTGCRGVCSSYSPAQSIM